VYVCVYVCACARARVRACAPFDRRNCHRRVRPGAKIAPTPQPEPRTPGCPAHTTPPSPPSPQPPPPLPSRCCATTSRYTGRRCSRWATSSTCPRISKIPRQRQQPRSAPWVSARAGRPRRRRRRAAGRGGSRAASGRARRVSGGARGLGGGGGFGVSKLRDGQAAAAQ
jgi:hypothetical protein